MKKPKKKKWLLPTARVMLALWIVSIIIAPMGTTIDTSMSAKAETFSISGESVAEQILSVEDATLQNYSIEDLIATQSFLHVRPYEGSGRVIDVNEDGIVNIFDLCLMKRNYKVTGNYNILLTEMINGAGASNTTTYADGTKSTNRVAVRATQEYDFSEFAPVSVLSDNEYKYLLQFKSFDEASNCINALQDVEEIVYAEMDEIVSLPDDDMNDEFESNSLTSDIQASSNSWGVSTIEADKFAKYLQSNFNSHVTVAVVDTGVSNHPFLSGRLLNGGRDYVNGDNDPTDDQGHGTHVAGTIVDCTPGLNIDILPVKVMYPHWERKYGQWVLEGSGNNSQISAGINYATDMGVDVINLSLGGKGDSKQIDDAISRAVNKGVTVVVSAGNDDADTKYYCPAHISNAIVVSAIDSSLSKASFSNFGQSVDVAAPGVSIKSCLIGGIYDPDGKQYYYGDYASWNGTSMAAPHIAAAAAMIKYQYPNYTPAQIESTLISTCMDLGTSGKDIYYGYGVPKLSKLMKEQVKPTISLSSTSATLYKGQKFTLSASVTPGDVDVKWTTSDSSVATVNNGVVTANGEGSATITAFFTYDGTNYPATCKITVKKPGITLNETSKSIYQTNTFMLTANTLPSNRTVFWSSSNSNVATVSNGLVTAVASGTATITASFTYEGETYSASCNITVKEVSIKLDQSSKSLYQTDEFNLNATVTPTGQSINWTTSNSSIATVSNGRVVAINPGTATITASFVYGGKTFSASCSVNVKKVSVELDTHSKTLIVGDTSSITAITSPPGLTVSWESSNNMVASVSSGKITAKAPGKITAKATITYNGKEYSDSCSVTVVEPSVKINPSQVKISKNETYQLNAETLPDGVTVSWNSEDNNICTVDSKGKITGKATGNTMVYATISYGGETYQSSCNVIVGEPKVTLNKTSMTMNKGDVESLIASVIAVDGVNITSETKSDISWSSSNTNVATVDSNGSVKAVAVGEATITAKYTFCGINYTASCKVCVPEIKLNKSSLSLYVGDTSTLTKTVTPSSASVSWSSSNTSVATVDSSGKINAKSAGSATITAKFIYDGNTYSATCVVTVNKPGVTFSPTSKSIYLGDSFTITANVKSGGQTVTWSSSNTSVAAVDSNGKVTGKGAGTATITAKFIYAGTTYSATCSVTVEKPSLSFSQTSKSVYVSDSFTINASVKPSGQTVTWSSSNTSVATVDSSGKVTAKGTGSATITGKFTYNGSTYSATCSVNVQGKPGISLNKSSLSMYIGDTSTLTASVTPANSTVTWSSSNTSIATVNSSGKVTMISAGSATITASIRYNGVNYSTTCSVTVTKPSITVKTQNTLSSDNGVWLGDQYVYMSKSGNIPSGVSVVWKSSNTNVVTVDSSGHISTVNGGTATITGSFSYGGNTYSASDTVKVITQNSVRTFFIYPSSDSDKHIVASGNSSTLFTLNANVGFVADRVTIQVTSIDKQLQNNDTIYDYVAYSNENNMTKEDVSHWSINTRFTGFSAGTYLVRCRAYNGSSSATAYVRLIIT
ncbi:MAG: Ig-like domain-containing protein [Oscillospiraceae bacterium]|nr:Ig-like domain-containing protein [Oscillospiraceae bacterium]